MKTRNFNELKDCIPKEVYDHIKNNYAGDSFYISTKDYEFSSPMEKIKYIQELYFGGKSVKYIANELGMSEDRVNHLKNVKMKVDNTDEENVEKC